MAGPLSGIRIVEIAGIGPGPFCAMMLADQGAEVIHVHRPGGAPDPRDPLVRSRKLLEINLKTPEGVAQVRELAKTADGFLEGLRPGVMERLGLGPDVLLSDNPKLVYGRMTGWGQTGPYAPAAGHDINYIALSGTLHTCGRKGDKPTPPVNYLGDFGGGGMMLAFGMVTALLNAAHTGKGQVIDCAMVDGAALLAAMTWGWRATAGWHDTAGVNLLDTGAHFYDTYETADGKFISIGSIEPQFYAQLRQLADLEDDAAFDDQMNPAAWGPLKDKLTTLFRSRTRDEWCALMEHTDVCFAPVLSMEEAPQHPHNVERETFIEIDGVVQPAPAPRFLGTPVQKPRKPEPMSS